MQPRGKPEEGASHVAVAMLIVVDELLDPLARGQTLWARIVGVQERRQLARADLLVTADEVPSLRAREEREDRRDARYRLREA